MDNRKYGGVKDNVATGAVTTRKKQGVGINSPDTVMNDRGWYLLNPSSEPNYDPITQNKPQLSYAFDIDTLTVNKIYTIKEKTLNEVKDTKLTEVKTELLKKQTNPIVDTGLGYSVDGARENLDDFSRNLEYMKRNNIADDTVRDSDNNYQLNQTQDNFQTIIDAIFNNGKAILGWKWQTEETIKNSTIDELKLLKVE